MCIMAGSGDIEESDNGAIVLTILEVSWSRTQRDLCPLRIPRAVFRPRVEFGDSIHVRRCAPRIGPLDELRASGAGFSRHLSGSGVEELRCTGRSGAGSTRVVRDRRFGREVGSRSAFGAVGLRYRYLVGCEVANCAARRQSRLLLNSREALRAQISLFGEGAIGRNFFCPKRAGGSGLGRGERPRIRSFGVVL